jgi:putative ABC transport system permease protein
MLRHYLTIAFRQFKKNKLYSAINILCLTIGISFSLFIGVYIMDQLAINKDLRNSDRQYILKSKWKEKDLGPEITTVSALAKGLKEEYPHLVANYYRYNPVTNVVSAGDRFFKEDISIGDTTLISMYDFPLVHGDRDHAFPNQSSAVITETLALKLFDTKNAIGKTLTVQNTIAGDKQDYTVSAVMKDIPYNSVTHVINANYSVFLPTTGNRYYGYDPSQNWDQSNEISFIELQPGISPDKMKLALESILKKYSPDFIWKYLTVETIPVKNYHLKDNNRALARMITMLALISVFVLLMVIINFININIGTSSYRLKEIGLRKTFGSERKHLIRQFILEALAITTIATVFSLLVYQVLRPVFGDVLNTRFESFWQFSFYRLLLLLGFVVLIGVLAGLYPALVLSGTNLVQAVKGKISSGKGGLILKRVLLVAQFSLAIFVFICGLNVSRQVSYIFSKDPGYNKDQLLVLLAFPKQWDSAGILKMESIKQGLLQVPAVKNVSITFELPEGIPNSRIVLYPPKSSSAEHELNLPIVVADEDYATTLGIKVIAGSFFHESQYGLILNETAVKQLGLDPQAIVGQKIQTPIRDNGIQIVGVVKDYHTSGMQEKIGPIGFIHVRNRNTYRFLAVKLNTRNMYQTIESIKTKWRQMVPNSPFDYSFMDEKFASLYRTELQLQTASRIATVLNLVIVALGIIGVMAFMLQKRLREMAVRKVLGAAPADIIMIFLKEYAPLIIIAGLLACPVAYLITESLLSDFAYRVQQNMAPYLIALGIVALISVLLISVQCFRTAIESPVKNLKSE